MRGGPGRPPAAATRALVAPASVRLLGIATCCLAFLLGVAMATSTIHPIAAIVVTSFDIAGGAGADADADADVAASRGRPSGVAATADVATPTPSNAQPLTRPRPPRSKIVTASVDVHGVGNARARARSSFRVQDTISLFGRSPLTGESDEALSFALPNLFCFQGSDPANSTASATVTCGTFDAASACPSAETIVTVVNPEPSLDGTGDLATIFLPAFSVPDSTTLRNLTLTVKCTLLDVGTTVPRAGPQITFPWLTYPKERILVTPAVVNVGLGREPVIVNVTCVGGSGVHLLSSNISSVSSTYVAGKSGHTNLTSPYFLSVYSATPATIQILFTCTNPSNARSHSATFAYNVNGCVLVSLGTLSYCDGAVIYPVDSRLSLVDADARALAGYQSDLYNHWNQTGWVPPPKSLNISNHFVLEDVPLIGNDCLAMRRRWHCAKQFPRCQQARWDMTTGRPSFHSGICREICSEVIKVSRCGDLLDARPACHLANVVNQSLPTRLPGVADSADGLSFNASVQYYPLDLCAHAFGTSHHYHAAVTLIVTLLAAAALYL